MRRKPSSNSASRIIRDNHRHRANEGSRTRADLEHGPIGTLEIVDDFPDLVPVTQSELDVIETYLGSLLDDLLKRGP
jgi:hypothetical protein